VRRLPRRFAPQQMGREGTRVPTSIDLFVAYAFTIGAGLRVVALELDELLFHTAGALGVLAAFEFAGGAALGGDAFAGALELVGEEFPGGEAVGGLGAVFLHLDEDAGGGVAELDAGGDFIDVLAAGAAGVGEGFFDAGHVAAEGDEVGAEVVGGEGAHLEYRFTRRNAEGRRTEEG